MPLLRGRRRFEKAWKDSMAWDGAAKVDILPVDESVIPRRSNQIDGRSKLDRQLYRGRNIIERCVGWLKENRRLGMRYEKLAVNFDAMVKLGMIRHCLRRLDSSNRA